MASMEPNSREYLLSLPGPEIREPMDALRLLIECDSEASELMIAMYFDGWRPDAHAMAGYARRRAYILVHAAALWPEFEAAADAAITWERYESAAVHAAVEQRLIEDGLRRSAGASVEPVAEREP